MTEGAKRRAGPIAAALVLVVLATLGGALIGAAGPDPKHATTAAVPGSVLDDRFAMLSDATSNVCGLGAAELRRMEDGTKLQGSCCFPMDRAQYEEQLRELRPQRRTGVVPRDPYDVPVVLAKRLLTHRDIPLDREERDAYMRATEISDQGGPCCCPCWRWEAFKGQAHFLLSRRGWSASEVARLWDAEEGCGGPGEHA